MYIPKFEARVIEDASQRNRIKWEPNLLTFTCFGDELKMLTNRLFYCRGGSVAGTVVRIPDNGRFAYLEVRVVED